MRKREEGREVDWKKRKQYLEWVKTEDSGVPEEGRREAGQALDNYF